MSAPFIAQFFTAQLQQVLPYCDIIIGNESEAEAWASAVGLPDTKDLKAIAKSIAISPKSNPSRPRVVVFTQGADSTVLVSSAEQDTPKVFPVTPLTDDKIVDTNGAGDAFAGGFVGAFVAGKELDECVEVGHKMGGMCVQQVRFRSLVYLFSPISQPSYRSAHNTSGPRPKSSKHCINNIVDIMSVTFNSDINLLSVRTYLSFHSL